MYTILIIDDVKGVRDQLAYDLQRKSNRGDRVLTAENGKAGLAILAEENIDVIILDLEMPEMDGLEMLEQMSGMNLNHVPVIVYTGVGNYQKCVKAVQLGAYNFFDKSKASIDQLQYAIENACKHRDLRKENELLQQAALKQNSPIIGISAATKQLRERIVRIAAVPSNVFIQGESGSGKELVARELHRLSPRTKRAFVAVNCAAIPENLVESELFGFEKGAFSGAAKTTKGKFEIASGGTLFLDEIGDMPLSAQAKLLRVIQEGEMTRIGGEGRVIKVDVRVLAATHRNIEQLVESEHFRRDLYYRVCTHVIKVPPLRERLDDIGPLALFFAERITKRFNMEGKRIAPETVQILRAYEWRQNNIRELENAVERMLVNCPSNDVQPEHVPMEIRRETAQPDTTKGKTYQQLKEESERQILLRALEANDWHITNTAKALSIANHSNLLKMMRRLGIKRPGK